MPTDAKSLTPQIGKRIWGHPRTSRLPQVSRVGTRLRCVTLVQTKLLSALALIYTEPEGGGVLAESSKRWNAKGPSDSLGRALKLHTYLYCTAKAFPWRLRGNFQLEASYGQHSMSPKIPVGHPRFEMSRAERGNPQILGLHRRAISSEPRSRSNMPIFQQLT
jgi:hypothetical protein